MNRYTREAIKYLVVDGRYDFIETGSLIFIRENVENNTLINLSVLTSTNLAIEQGLLLSP